MSKPSLNRHPSARQEAKAQGLPRYFTGLPCKNGHVSERHTSKGVCIACLEIAKRSWEQKYPERHRDGKRRRSINESGLATKRRQYAKHRDRYLQKVKDWAKSNPAKITALSRKHQAARLMATPPWLSASDMDAILVFYIWSRFMTENFGQHHVDHIVPIKGKNVCGLHVPWNLRVVPQRVNQTKSNQFNEQ